MDARSLAGFVPVPVRAGGGAQRGPEAAAGAVHANVHGRRVPGIPLNLNRICCFGPTRSFSCTPASTAHGVPPDLPTMHHERELLANLRQLTRVKRHVSTIIKG